ncbi:hypothetical protein RJ639_035231 [Escallonia herrerae]|uniref:Methyltransferase type 11 domain-containing protein n=1 Tax=Escallonia herrerae TaxID=1293975 RepID=A0AA88X2Y0_9ASTE|nr:hypothetical protein RJ639_035231 [Escallonia herrerae]
MGSGADEYKPRKQPHQHIQTKFKLKMLVLVILTNLLTIYIFTGSSFNLQPITKYTQQLSLPLWESTTLLQELNTTKHELASSHSQISHLHRSLASTNSLIEALLIGLARLHESTTNNQNSLGVGMPDEVKLAIGRHKLPLGYSPRTGSDEVHPPVGGGCLRKNVLGYYDCKDCFDLKGREKTRWMFDNGGLDYGMDQVLRAKSTGSIRIGLDTGGGTGTFAARMKERNVTIITSTMNLDGPFNSFIESRGLIPMHVSVSQRLPFFENTLDIVHSMHVLSNWIPDAMLEFTLYDIYRVL